MNRIQTIEALLSTIDVDGLGALVREGLRRRMSIREVARHLNIPVDNAAFFAIGHENEFPLQPGDRVRLLTDSIGWRGNGTVIEQKWDRVTFWKDGTPKPDSEGYTPGGTGAMRHEVELTDVPELLPEGASFDDNGYVVVPCATTPTGRQLQFYCPHCKSTHRHGLPGGYVGAHCHKRDSPLLARGSIYLLPRSLQ